MSGVEAGVRSRFSDLGRCPLPARNPTDHIKVALTISKILTAWIIIAQLLALNRILGTMCTTEIRERLAGSMPSHPDFRSGSPTSSISKLQSLTLKSLANCLRLPSWSQRANLPSTARTFGDQQRTCTPILGHFSPSILLPVQRVTRLRKAERLTTLSRSGSVTVLVITVQSASFT